MAEILTIGETMAVMAPSGSGKLGGDLSFSLKIAGAESNTAIGVCRLGHTAAWISSVGDDELGRYVTEEVSKEGVDVSYVKTDTSHRTGLMIKEFIGDKTNVYYYRENSAASHISPEDIPFCKLEDTKILHLTGITPTLSKSCRLAVLELMRWASERGVLISFDPNIRRKIWGEVDYIPLLREMLSFSDIALLGLSEAKEIYGTDEISRIASSLLDEGVSYAVIKDGKNGAYAISSHEFIFVPPYPCTPVDSVGAGDGFNAGFLSGILEGRSLAESARMGALVGAMATESVGDVNGYPTREELCARLGF